ncbi:hypothetical protein LBMAG46_13250 [Planctomycetia bacterium]|nr:hypothetical protein LBMAG46_13250 [Planctomycetia bacterium]
MNRLVVFFNDRDTEGTQEGGEWSYRDRDSEGTGVNVGAWWCVPVSSSGGVSPCLRPRAFPRWCVPVAPVPVAGVVCQMGLVGARRVRRGQVGYSMIVLIP